MTIKIMIGDCRAVLAGLPDESVQACVTSPPYFGLRDYGVNGQIGLEPTLDEYIEVMVSVFREVRRVMRADATLWLNLGDSFCSRPAGANGLKHKDLMMVPARVAIALQSDGWWLRRDIVWSKPNAMPESVSDRPTSSHEYVFLLSKSKTYRYDADAIRENRVQTEDANTFRGGAYVGGSIDNGTTGKRQVVGNKKVDKQRGHSRRHAGFNDRWDQMEEKEQCAKGRNSRSVWEIATFGFPDAHFATFPPRLAERCILAGAPPGSVVLDPFMGAGTTMMVADRLGREAIGIELNPEYAALAEKRIRDDAGMFVDIQRAVA
jgi:DNA modification methylase